MARIRTIKPEFFTSEDIVRLSPLARLLYVALWCESDREGRFQWKPMTIKLRYFPGDDCKIDELLGELDSLSLVIPYEVDGSKYGEIPGFTKHQVINNRESESELPPHPSRVNHASTTRESGREGKEGKGKEGKGRKEGDAPPSKNPAKKITSDWQPNERSISMIEERGLTLVQARPAISDFVRWAIESGKKAANWDLAFQRNPVVKSNLEKLARNNGNATGNGSGDSYNDRLDRAEKLINDAAGR